jgi:hypothetical protein
MEQQQMRGAQETRLTQGFLGLSDEAFNAIPAAEKAIADAIHARSAPFIGRHHHGRAGVHRWRVHRDDRRRRPNKASDGLWVSWMPT